MAAAAAAVAEAANPKSRGTERRHRRRPKAKKGTNAAVGEDSKENADPNPHPQVEVEVEYVPDKADIDPDDPLLGAFTAIFQKFSFADPAAAKAVEEEKEGAASAAKKKGSDAHDDDDYEQEIQKKGDAVALSNKQRKQLQRIKIAELKQICDKPDVVEVWDATAADPKLLVHLKSYRNTVPVPRHWSQKRKFLQGKRGIEKRPFQLPDFIAATGIDKIRQAYIEKENSKKLKQKQRDRMQPKMGKIDIDYQVLHDAFFKYQTKPKLTTHGDLYYEGKEFEVKLREMKPGMLSRELKEALGMTDGDLPPWLVNMQRYGPPPSYPYLKIPGLNAPISSGHSFGDRAGEWGQPPINEEEPLDRSKHWGELDEEEEEEDEEAEELTECEEIEEGTWSVDTISSTPAGMETPDVIDLRKAQRKEPDDQAEKSLYQVLEKKEESIAPEALFGSIHWYTVEAQDKPSSSSSGPKRVDLLKNQRSERVDVTLHPEELEVMDDVLPAKYEEAREEERLGNQKEDFSDMVAENASKMKRKHDKEGGSSSSSSKKKNKKKDFKF